MQHVQKAGCWEAIVTVLWDPPTDELDTQGRKRSPPRAPASGAAPVPGVAVGVGGAFALDGDGMQS
eukprot:scaffold304652_cov49-Tisochrysis_lutea.AAC.1